MENEEYDWSLLETAGEMEFDGWRPEAGDSIMGTVAYVSTGQGNFGEYPMLAVVSRDGEPVMVHAFHTVLRNEIERQDPQTGDKLFLKYRGEGKAKEGQDAPHLYTLIVDKRGRAALTTAASLPALPPGEQHVAADEAERPEPAGWEVPAKVVATPAAAAEPDWGEPNANDPATDAQKAAIDKLRHQNGQEPLDWSVREATVGQAREYIKKLQAS